MQRRILYTRAMRDGKNVLYINTGDKFLDKMTTRAHIKKAAIKHFKKTVGGKPDIEMTSTLIPEHERAVKNQIKSNELCPEYACPLYGDKPVDYCGPDKPLIMVIGEAPEFEDYELGTSSVSKSEKMLSHLLSAAKYMKEYGVTNVICCPPDDIEPTSIEKACCLNRLLSFLDYMKPKGVICVGDHAANTFFPLVGMQGEKSFPVNCLRTVDMGSMRFIHIKHPDWFLRKGVNIAGQVKNKRIREEVEDTIFSLKLFKEMITTVKVPKRKQGWSWVDQIDRLLSQEIKRGRLLVPADKK